MSRFRLTLLTSALFLSLLAWPQSPGWRFDPTAYGQGSSKRTWPVQTKGQEGLREPQEPSTLPAPTSEFSKPSVGKAARELPQLVRSGAGEWRLAGGWRLREAPKVSDEGVAVSRPGYADGGWLRAVVPGTVLTTLVERGIYPDPDYGLNNLAIPETLNKQDYWYRTEFKPPASTIGRRFRVTLGGVNYSAVAWLNGRRLGEVRGAFKRGTFDATNTIVPGRVNALAVRVSPPPHPGIPHEESLKAGPGPNGGAMCLDGPTFICTEGWDWIPGVRDRATGLWQDVTLRATGGVRVGDVQVVTKLPLPDTTRASVSVSVPLGNETTRAAVGLLEVAFEGVTIRKRVRLEPGETKLNLTPAEFPQLKLKQPRLWWPNGYGRPELYHMRVSFREAGGVESDSKSLRFGIRELSYELTLLDGRGRLRRVEYDPSAAQGVRVVNVTHEGIVESAEGWVASFMQGAEVSSSIRALEDRRASPHLVVRVNGVRIACRGGNWGLDDSRKRVSRKRMEPFFRLHREAGLTMIRNWCGQNTEEVFYDLADEYGLLVWNDFWLSTQDWNLEPEDPALFLANARDVIERFRNHPSIAIWCGRNEGVPPPAINEGLDELTRALDGTRYYSPNSRDINLQGSGPWHYGDAFKFFTTRGRGFSTELGLPSPPSADTIRAMLPESDQWPPDDAWAYHDWHSKSGGDTGHFMNALTEELGAPVSLEDFDRKAQLLTYVSHRAMFEGFNAHLWEPNTGRLMWMTHPAWPSMEWQMYSSDYSTHGAFFGVKKACEPAHAQLDEPDAGITVVNNTTRALKNLLLIVRVVDVNGVGISTHEERVNAPANAAVHVFRLEMPAQARDGVVFVRLTLADDAGRVLSENFYWRSAQKSGYRKLNEMAEAVLDCSAVLQAGRGAPRVEVELTNRGDGVALAAQVVVRDAVTHERVLPAYASDNFVSLLPGEARRVHIEVPARGREMAIELKGWNVRGALIPVTPAR
jgi:beta-galactosidase/beta-glucuronidase